MSGKKVKSKNQVYKRKKVQDARTIRTEALRWAPKSSQELSESGSMLKIPEFMSSREFEIKQLQVAIHKSKSASSTRVFQSLPRKLRRRTASHNVKRIPKRLRNRALREMQKSDQTVTKGTEALSRKRKYGLTAKQLYKARMAVKLLRLAAQSKSMKLALPAQATASHHKLRSRIKSLRKMIGAQLNEASVVRRNNKMGSYDSTGLNTLAEKPLGRIKYMKRQRSFTWLPTHVWNAKRSHMLKRWGYQIPWSPTQKCFKLTHRIGGIVSTSDGAMCSDTSYMGTIVVSCSDSESLKQLISSLTNKKGSLPRYRTSGNWFEGLIYNEELEVLGPLELLWINEKKCFLRLHPAIYLSVFDILTNRCDEKFNIQDCRYSIASINITGGKALNALSQVLRSTGSSKSYNQLRSVSYLTDVDLLPQKTAFAFEAIDPRHLSHPKKLSNTKPDIDTILQLQDNFPSDEITAVLEKLADPNERENSYKNQQTLKQLSSRRRMLLDSTSRTNAIPFKADEDPSIPIAIFKQPKQKSWVVLLPWYWLLPLWYQLNRVSRVYHMGLRQLQQLSYENRNLYFPDDYPFTQVGYQENSICKRSSLEALWKRKPPGKRQNFSKIAGIHPESPVLYPGELGDPFSCDWRLLQILRNGIDFLKSRTDVPLAMYDSSRTTQFDELNQRKLLYVNDIVDLYSDVLEEKLIPSSLPVSIYSKAISREYVPNFTDYSEVPHKKIATTPLPIVAVSCVLQERGHPKDFARIYSIPEQHIDYWTSIANMKARPNGKRDHDTKNPVPAVQNLIGFVTSGTFHLGDGLGACTGFIEAQEACKSTHNYVLVRNVGTNVYRVAKWKQIGV